ncbi:MAG: hypothetical protein CSB24_07130 [Deltaproteobacteria bacterium]|nr:MAG: hypothetical protein CSB24_07130 [Deltaproteobacteria bacterium]
MKSLVEKLIILPPLVVKIFALLIGLILVIWSIFGVGSSHAHIRLEKIPAFWSIFGLAACIMLIFIAILIGKAIRVREN